MVVHTCVSAASAAYDVPPAAVERVLSAHESAGLGAMHIPRAWLPILARVGFAPAKVARDRCSNIAAGTWILAFETWRMRTEAPAGRGSRPPAAASAAIRGRPGGVTAACIAGAAQYYHLSPALFGAVLRTEGGKVGRVHRNKNGSYDIGPAQINSTWLPTLARAGITRRMVLDDGCLNVSIGAWILAQAMRGADPGNPRQWWQHVGDYNSHTPRFNARYARSVWSHLAR